MQFRSNVCCYKALQCQKATYQGPINWFNKELSYFNSLRIWSPLSWLKSICLLRLLWSRRLSSRGLLGRFFGAAGAYVFFVPHELSEDSEEIEIYRRFRKSRTTRTGTAAIDIHGPHVRCGWHFYMTFLIPQAHFSIKLISHLKAPTPQDRGDISGGLD